MNWLRSKMSMLAIVFLALSPVTALAAQDIPATPVPAQAPSGVLAEFPIDSLPTPHAEIWFLRMGLEPGGSFPAGEQMGPTVVSVESGDLTLVTDRPVATASTAEPATPQDTTASPASAETETVVQPGASVFITGGTTVTAVNNGDAPTTFLIVLMFAAELESMESDTVAQPVGLTQQGISVGKAEFPDGPGHLVIERVVVEPGDTLESDSGQGVDLGALEQGSAEVTFATGTSWQWPHMLIAFEDLRPIQVGSTIELATGDGYATYDGSSTWSSTGDQPLILLRLTVVPDS